MPSSRAIRSKRRDSQVEVFGIVGSSLIDFEEAGPAEGFLAAADLSSTTLSPNMTESMESSMPMKSRITRRVTRCQKDSLSSGPALLPPWIVSVI